MTPTAMIEKRRSSVLRRLARKFAALFVKGREIQKKKTDVGGVLKEAMADEGGLTAVDAGSLGMVFYVHDLQKRVSKQNLVDFFGQEQADKFWDQLGVSEVEYLTVKPKGSGWTR